MFQMIRTVLLILFGLFLARYYSRLKVLTIDRNIDLFIDHTDQDFVAATVIEIYRKHPMDYLEWSIQMRKLTLDKSLYSEELYRQLQQMSQDDELKVVNLKKVLF